MVRALAMIAFEQEEAKWGRFYTLSRRGVPDWLELPEGVEVVGTEVVRHLWPPDADTSAYRFDVLVTLRGPSAELLQEAFKQMEAQFSHIEGYEYI